MMKVPACFLNLFYVINNTFYKCYQLIKIPEIKKQNYE